MITTKGLINKARREKKLILETEGLTKEFKSIERRYHKLDHLSATAQYAVAHDFDRYDKVERRYDTQELHAYVKRARR